MRKIKNWKVFNESVEVSLEDIKWVLVDYDYIVPYDYYPNSTNLLVFRISGYGFSKDDFGRIERLANEESWSVLCFDSRFLIFYKGTKEEAVLNWLEENYNDLNTKMQFSEKYYCNSEGFSLFSTSSDMKVGVYWNTDVNANPELWKIPSFCIGDANLLDDILKNWLERTYGITKITNIYYED
jgi:hypothetical protein